MKINEPIGNPNLGPLFLRLGLGAYFILAGWAKLAELPAFIERVRGLNVLGPNAARLYGTLLPYLEIFCGGLLCLGFWTTLAALIASLLLASFIYALKIFPNENFLFNKDIILLCASICIMFTGAGSLSMDKFRRGG